MSDLERYRPSMHSDTLRSWAVDAQAKIDELTSIINNAKASLMGKNVAPVQSPDSDPHRVAVSDADLLSFLASNAEWDGDRSYWLPKIRILEQKGGDTYTPPPTLGDLRNFLKGELEEQLRVNQEATSRRPVPR